MGTFEVGVQTSFKGDNAATAAQDVSMAAVHRRLTRLIKGLPPDSHEMDIEVHRTLDSIVWDEVEPTLFKTVASGQVDHLPKKSVSTMSIKDEGTFAVAMLHRELGQQQHQGSGTGEVYNIDIASNIPTLAMRCIFGVSRLLFPKGTTNRLIGGSICGSVHLWDTNTCNEVHVIPPDYVEGHISPIVALDLPDDDSLISVDATGKVFTWSLRNLSKPLSSMNWGQERISPIVSSAWHNSILYCGTMTGELYSCNVDSGPSEPQTAHGSVITAVASSRASNIGRLATSSFDCSLKIWEWNDLTEPVVNIMPSNHCITGIAWSPSSPTVMATVDGTSNISLWNFSENVEVVTMLMFTNDISPQVPVCIAETGCPGHHTSVAWTPSGKLLLVGGIGVTIVKPTKEGLMHGSDTLSNRVPNLRGGRTGHTTTTISPYTST